MIMILPSAKEGQYVHTFRLVEGRKAVTFVGEFLVLSCKAELSSLLLSIGASNSSPDVTPGIDVVSYHCTLSKFHLSDMG